MLAVWEELDCESVGARELTEIQAAVGRKYSGSAVDSPAAIARLLADEGAILRHPEVLEYDAKWREARLTREATYSLNFEGFSVAVQSLIECERVRRELEQHQDKQSLAKLRDAMALGRQELLLSAISKDTPESARSEFKEIAGWLEVWLRTPELFVDWLDLRRASPEFRRRFGE